MPRRKPAFEVTTEVRFPDLSCQYTVERLTHPQGRYYATRKASGALELSPLQQHSALESRCIRAAIERWMRDWGQL